MASYLIPKSARNVKLQIFKGLGMTEIGFVLGAVILGLLVFNTNWNIVVRAGVSFLLVIAVTFLVSPSFISNKKGYETFEIIFNYMGSHKYYKKIRRVKK
ncbi:TPA: CbtA family protein [bacterium]|nr:CbtA family protein [bacterium]